MVLLNSKQLRQVAVTSGDYSLSRGNNITPRVLYTQRSSFLFPTSLRISRLKEMNFHRGQNWNKKNSLGKPFLSSRQDFPAIFFSPLLQSNGIMYNCWEFSLGIVIIIFLDDLYDHSGLFSTCDIIN